MTFVVIWFAMELNEFVIAGFSLAFYVGAQGALIVYVLIVWIYARRMNRMDKACGLQEGED